MLKKISFLLFLFIFSNLFAEDLELKKIFDEKKVEGTIVIESLNKKKVFIYNDKRADSFFSPASTFKIPNTLIALNEGIVNKDSIIVWDKKDKGRNLWNQDQTLKTAFNVSCLWCYKKFASEIGIEKYKKYLEKLDYGNKNLGNNVTKFWLDGSLRITAFDQIKFLKRLYLNDLPFKQEDINTLKEIMIDEKNENYTIRAKTGWSVLPNSENVWYVGYIETKDDVWFFATNLAIKNEKEIPFRKEITLEALKVKGII